MITNKDLIILADIFPTKEDFRDLSLRMDNLESTNRALLTSIDNLAKATRDLKESNVMFRSALDRHERWIKELASETKLMP